MKFSASTEINATAEKAWARVEHVEEWPRWIPSLKKIEKISEGPFDVGSRVRITAKFVVTVNFVMTITELVPSRRVVLEGKVLGNRMRRYYTLEPMNRKAILTAGGDVSGPLSFLVRYGVQRLSEEIVQALKERIERSV
ncbi:MAG: SRPBCC family protein [Dehalococcoidia bacterium]